MTAPTFDWISFDLYGSLIDLNLGLRMFFNTLLTRKRISLPAEQLIKAWHPAHLRLLQQPWKRYREILYDSLGAALSACKVTYEAEDGHAFADAFGSWRPYADVVGALPRLQSIAKIAILANADREFTNRSVTYLGIAPNLVLTSEDVRFYKPSGKLFVAALAKMYAPSPQCLHVTAQPETDLEPAHKLGFKTCLLRRTSTPYRVPVTPHYDVPSLLALCGRLGAKP